MTKNTVRSEDPARYVIEVARGREEIVIEEAMEILVNRMKEPGEAMTSPGNVRKYLCLRARDLDVEHFAVMFLDVQNRMICVETLFTGTLTQTSVYPREVVRRALTVSAAAVVLTHNHPSGSTLPSRTDETLTQTLKAALALVDVRVLDHVITAGAEAKSMAEMGLI